MYNSQHVAATSES